MPEIPSVGKVYRFSQYGSPDYLTLGQDPVPKPGHGEVLLKIHAVALNYRDLKIALAEYPVPSDTRTVPVSECGAEIVALGPGCSRFGEGERVITSVFRDLIRGEVDAKIQQAAFGGPLDGFLREYAVVPEHCLVRIPEGLSWEEGATLAGAGVTAWNALVGHVPIQGGDIVLIQGTGGVSIFGLQLAVAMGAKVIVTSSSDSKLQLAKKLGAHHLINYKTTPDWEKEVMKLTNDEGVDRILEVGGRDTLTKSFACIKYGGTIANIGYLAGSAKGTDIAMLTLFRSVIFRGVLIGSREQLEGMCRLFDATGIRPVVDRVFEFGEAREAYRYFASQKHVGKVVIRIA